MSRVQKEKVVVSVDMGTTSTKTIVFAQDGTILGSHSEGYPLFTPQPDRAEQDPLQIFQAVMTGIQTVLTLSDVSSSEVLCVSFSSAMHSLLVVDEHVNPLSPCMTWADNRSEEYVKQLKVDSKGHDIYMATGTPIHPMSPLLKLMWLKEHDPQLFTIAYKFIGIKEFVFAKLFNQFVVDYSIASATGLFNLQHLSWHLPSLELAGVTAKRLSLPVSTTHRMKGLLDPTYAAEMGLSTDTPFIIGASDGVLANLGVGAFEPGIFAVTIGTSGAIRGVVRKPVTDPLGRLFCYALNEDFWVIGGAINNGGIMLRWVRDQLATLETEEARRLDLDPYDYLVSLAGGVEAGSGGLLFLPLLTGERAPYWNANARGVFFGLSLLHEKKHMIRAVLEGVVYLLFSIFAALVEIAGPALEIRASGGFARSAIWCQIMADVFETSVTVPNCIESSSIGAAYLGLWAMGEVEDLTGVHQWIQAGLNHQTNPDHHETYQQLTRIYTKVYHQLTNEFDEITAFQENTAFEQKK